jgi:enterochelin esterase-like enzyme
MNGSRDITAESFTVGGFVAHRHDHGHSAGVFHTYDAFTGTAERSKPRTVHVFIPRDYDLVTTRYRVVYMNDGDTAFFRAGLANQSWDVGRTLSQLYAHRTVPDLIIVAVCAVDRNREYTHEPWFESQYGGLDLYSGFLANDLKKSIDANYRTLPDAADTMVVGSSHGGLASFYTALRWPGSFGFVAAMSPSFWVGVDDATRFPCVLPIQERALVDATIVQRFADVLANAARRPRIYLDWGLSRTGGPHNACIEERATSRGREMAGILVGRFGYRLGYDLIVVEDDVGEHTEETWGRRLPPVLRHFVTAPPGRHGLAEDPPTEGADRPGRRRSGGHASETSFPVE